MKKFEFNNKTEVDLAGVVVGLKTDMATINKGIEFAKYMQKRGLEIQNDKSIKELDEDALIKKLDDVNNLLCDECYNFIDEITEKGTAEKIFKDRSKDIYDCIEIINFLVDTLNEHRTDKLKGKVNKYNPNRAERRNNKKKRH